MKITDQMVFALLFIAVGIIAAGCIWSYHDIRIQAFRSGYCETLSPGRRDPVWMKCK